MDRMTASCALPIRVEPLEGRRLFDAIVLTDSPADTATDPAADAIADAAAAPDPAADPVAARPAVPRVVRRYAPLVFLHSDEQNFPTTGQWFIDHSELRWARPLFPDDSVDKSVDASRLGEASDNPYTHEYNDRTYEASDYTRPRGTEADRNGLPTDYGFFLNLDNDNRGGLPSTSPNRGVYRSAARVYYDYRPRNKINYWFFFAFNDGPGPQNHEGDWERIEVKLNAANRASGTVYHQHGGSDTLSWRRTPKVGGTHPVVYSAKGSHASYPTPGRHRVFDVTNAGKSWATWNALINVRTRPFYGFGGAWGEVGELTDTTGPLGPSRYKQ